MFPRALRLSISSSIIEQVNTVCQAGLATIAFFYVDFRDGDKQDIRGLLSSILIQLCNQSDNFSEILSSLFANMAVALANPARMYFLNA